MTIPDEIMSETTPPLYAIPILDRPPTSRLRSIILIPLSFLVLLLMHLSQLAAYPLSYIPGGIREAFWSYNRLIKESFGRLLILLSGGTILRITMEGMGEGEVEEIWKKDEEGRMVLGLERRSLFISNHQNYADWIYLWCLFYFAELGGSIIIVLKASLRRVPIGGLAMQLFEFLFLSQSPGLWDQERHSIGIRIKSLARRAEKYQSSLAILLYPEGTLFSGLTKPNSAKYAEKMGIPDLRNLLIPRSTGTFFALRALASEVSDASLYDITIGYPGIPAAGYSQSYYTLSSIYLSPCPPPIVHVHLRRYPLSEVPIGFIPAVLPRVGPAATTFVEPSSVEPSSVVPVLTADELDKLATQEDRNRFDEWLRTRWQEKDELLEQFYKEGKFGTGDQMKVSLGVIEIPLKLRGIDDYLGIFACFVGAYVGWRVIKFGVDSLLSVDFF